MRASSAIFLRALLRGETPRVLRENRRNRFRLSDPASSIEPRETGLSQSIDDRHRRFRLYPALSNVK